MKPLLAISTAVALTAGAEGFVHGQLVPYRDSERELWGYRDSAGAVVLPPRFLGAGEFAGGRAPVEDGMGFALISVRGEITERVRADSIWGVQPEPPPSRCASADLREFPSTSLQCYADALRSSSAVGGVIVRRRGRSESVSSAAFYRYDSGVVLVEERAYEGVRRRLLLPGVSIEEATRRRRLLYPDSPAKEGCGEYWTTGAVAGGAFIEQHAGC